MTVCGPTAMKLMQEFFESLPVKSTDSALDVAAGDGRVSRDLLLPLYNHIDAFDQSHESVQELQKLQNTNSKLENIFTSTMENFDWQKKYGGIWLSWCVGYLNKKKLIEFLKKAQKHLLQPQRKTTRLKPQDSYIFVLDTVRGREYAEIKNNGQRVRWQRTLEDIFEEAGLVVKD